MVINSSGMNQIFYWSTQSVEIPPRFIFDPSFYVGEDGFRRVTDVREEFEKAEKIVLQRTFGLGDVLMLIPVVRELKEIYPEKQFIISTVESDFRRNLIELLDEGFVDGVIENVQVERTRYDVGTYFDWYLERDHATPGYMETHRVDLYRRFLGLRQGVVPNWGEVTEGRNSYLVLHEGGNRDVKSFPKETFEYLLRKLSNLYNVKPLRRETRLPAVEYVELIMEAGCLVTLDSSPLWVSHFTATPIVAVLGPSRPEERITYHPLYPERATAIKLNEFIECPPCRETMGRCQHQSSCMKVPKEKIYEQLVKKIEEVRWKD